MDSPTEEPSDIATQQTEPFSLSSTKSSEPTTGDGDISDVVGFSLSSLCAIKLNLLYPEDCHESFRNVFIKQIIRRFKLPDRVEIAIKEFTPDDEFTFLSSIKQHYKHGPFKLIEELVLLSVSTGIYDARAHYLIIEVAELLGIPRDLVEIHCESIYDLLLKAQTGAIEEENDPQYESDRKKQDKRDKIKKYLMIGLASLGGGAVIGVTGGLAAPIVASAFAGVIGAGTVVMSSAAAGIVGSLFGVAGAGLTASKMNKRIGDLEEFAFESLSPENEQTSLTITIAISGWISDEGPQQFAKPWKYLRHTKEQYCLCYESKYLLELSRAMDYLLSFVVSYATQEALKYTFLASVMAAIAWPTALISIANIIDNPWDCCVGRSAQAGKHLADVLMSRQQGKRPASLIGFSLGARVIFFCLQELAQRKDSEGMIGDVVLLGAPVTASIDQWKPLGRIVSGRIINGYSSSDWLLKFLYRTSSAAIRVAGLQQLQWKDRRVKNVDLTPLVSGHMDYYKKLTEILNYVNVRTVVNFDDDLQLVASASLTETANLGAVEVAAVATSAEAMELGPPEANATTANACVQESLSTSDFSSSTAEPTTSTSISGTTSGIGRTLSNSTNLSASLSQQSLGQPVASAGCCANVLAYNDEPTVLLSELEIAPTPPTALLSLSPSPSSSSSSSATAKVGERQQNTFINNTVDGSNLSLQRERAAAAAMGQQQQVASNAQFSKQLQGNSRRNSAKANAESRLASGSSGAEVSRRQSQSKTMAPQPPPPPHLLLTGHRCRRPRSLVRKRVVPDLRATSKLLSADYHYLGRQPGMRSRSI